MEWSINEIADTLCFYCEECEQTKTEDHFSLNHNENQIYDGNVCDLCYLYGKTPGIEYALYLNYVDSGTSPYGLPALLYKEWLKIPFNYRPGGPLPWNIKKTNAQQATMGGK